MAALKHFYQNLYSSKIKSNDSFYLNQFLKPENIKSLGEEEKDLCEGLITDTEIKNVLKNMKNGTTAGMDGFPAEFYKKNLERYRKICYKYP